MPKFKINAKAVEGRERKAAAVEEKKKKKLVEEEQRISKEWEVGTKDMSKKAEEEARRLEKLEKKRERERLEALEAASIKIAAKTTSKTGQLESPPIITISSPLPNKFESSLLKFPMEPLNRPGSVVSTSTSARDFDSTVSEYSVSNVDDAILLLEGATSSSDKLNIERHPERRVKAAYAQWEQRELPHLKEENPTLRLSQIRQILKKKWQKASENPYNQATISYNASRDEETDSAREHLEKQMDRFKI